MTNRNDVKKEEKDVFSTGFRRQADEVEKSILANSPVKLLQIPPCATCGDLVGMTSKGERPHRRYF